MTVPYSSEFRVRETNQELIASLASVQPEGGEPGVVTVPLDTNPSEELVDTDAFRGGLALARSIRDAWPWFVLCGCCLFLTDIFVRRVAINFNWVGRTFDRLRGAKGEQDSVVTARLDALRKNKEALDDSLEKRRASVRFEPTEVDAGDDDIDLTNMSAPKRPKPDAKTQPAAEPEGPSYTERLLEAKRKAKRDGK